MRIVDLRGEAGYPLSAPLLAALGKVAEDGGKAILLLNRRGVAPALHCRACGETRRCPNCDVALVLHRDELLHCHHCAFVEPMPEACPECGSVELARIGAGTQRLERELEERVPELERFRLDADAVTERGALADTLRRFAAADRAVLVGTQIVAKGHHFTGVSLAAVIDADTGLAVPDFRAEERTFQLVTQLAGRSGRDAPGRVLVQTFQPESRAVALAARHDVEGFLEGELARREELGYPPFRHIVRVLVVGPGPGRRAAGGPGAGRGSRGRRRGSPRAGGALSAPRSPPGSARREDRPAARGRLPCGKLLGAGAPAMREADLSAVVDVDPQSV